MVCYVRITIANINRKKISQKAEAAKGICMLNECIVV